MTDAEKELAKIIHRNYSFFVGMAGLDAGYTDYSLRHDLLRLIEIADAVDPAGVVKLEPVEHRYLDERDQT